METTQLDLGAPGGELLASIAYLAVMAYPESHRKRDRAVLACLAFMNRAARHLGKPLSPIASELFRDVPQRRQGEILGTGQKGMLPRIYRRNLAARAAQRMISTGCSLHKVAEIYSGNESYFLHTVWGESKPVLHLAVGLRSVLANWQDDGRPPYLQLLARLGWVREAMTRAENWRRLLTIGVNARSAHEFMRHIDSEAFIRLVPADCADLPTAP